MADVLVSCEEGSEEGRFASVICVGERRYVVVRLDYYCFFFWREGEVGWGGE